MKNKIKDFFDVIKYKRKYNTLENKYETTLEKYCKLIEERLELADKKNNELKTINKLREELKRYRNKFGKIEEDDLFDKIESKRN